MIVELGPYAAGAARAWIANARQLLEFATSSRGTLPIDLPPEVIDTFRRYLDAWDAAADTGTDDTFHWTAEIEPTDLHTLLTYWLNLARVTRERKLPVSEEPARHFYPAVVADLLDALRKDPRYENFCDLARAAWPGLGYECDV